MKKIIHCDADCFYAAVEMRDDPALRNRPLAVGGSSDRRGVISTCNYEARRYGVRSAMASAHAMRLCPSLLIVPGRMSVYREVSREMREIFYDYTDLVEPLSLDEAYLDVTECERHNGSATLIAEEIRQRIVEKTQITVSAGVAPNKFIAKIASDWKKPNGLFVVTPNQVDAFVANLPVRKLHGVGPATATKLERLGVKTCADMRALDQRIMVKELGSFAAQLMKMAKGVDNREVKPNRERKSLSVEHTFAEDLEGQEQCLGKLNALIVELNKRLERVPEPYRVSKAYVKIKFSDFSTTTLEQIGTSARISDYRHLLTKALERKALAVRLIGIGVRFFEEKRAEFQMDLFEPNDVLVESE